MTLTYDALVVADPAVLAAELENDVVLLDAASGKYFNFQEVGAEIWRQLATPRRISDLCDHLAGVYDAPPDRIRATTMTFLQDLLQRRLIRVA